MGNMGQQALTSHMTKSKKHERNIEARNTINLDQLRKLGIFR